MQNALSIKIKKRTLPEWSAILIVFLPFVFGCLTDVFKLPSAVKFVSDFLIIVSIIVVVLRSFSGGRLMVSRIMLPISLLILTFFIYTFVGYILNFQSAFYYIWGIRNNFRFFAAFFIFVYFFDQDLADASLKMFDVLFWIHTAVTLFQFFVLGYDQDFLGGIFGVQKGCNGYVIAFMSVVIIRSVLLYMNGKETVLACGLKCGASLLISALAELKVFFFIFIFILIVSAAITEFSARKATLMIIVSILLMVASTLLVALFENFENFFSLDFLIKELFRENYASDEDMGRFTSVPIICKRFLTTPFDQLFGMGLGNCDTSTIPLFNTAFYDRYVDLHYSIFSISFMFIETGWIGLTLYISFFVACFIFAFKSYKQKRGNLLFNQIGIIMSLLCFVLLFYNSSLRTEAGYMIYFALSLPFIAQMNADTNESM